MPAGRRRDLWRPYRPALRDGVSARHRADHGAGAPTPLYEALAAFTVAGLLAWLGARVVMPAVFGAYLVLSGMARFLVELVRINKRALFGFTQPQRRSLLIVVIGVAILLGHRRLAELLPHRTTVPEG